jgi:hypothetical protein
LVKLKFTSQDLFSAIEHYHCINEGEAQKIYVDNILKYEGSLEGKIEAIIEVLGPWKGLRWKGSAKLKDLLSSWVSDNREALNSLEKKKSMMALDSDDYVRVVSLAGDFWYKGVPPTCYGKVLHFLLPDVILLWDEENVRSKEMYNLDGDPYSFAKYQSFGRRLIEHLKVNEGNGVVGMIMRTHVEKIGYTEPLPKIIDELAYSPELQKKAMEALGEEALVPLIVD